MLQISDLTSEHLHLVNSTALSLVPQSHPPFVFYLIVNCVCWAPHSYGLMLACASSDGTISILISDETNSWRAFRIPEAHSVSGSISCEFYDLLEFLPSRPRHCLKHIDWTLLLKSHRYYFSET